MIAYGWRGQEIFDEALPPFVPAPFVASSLAHLGTSFPFGFAQHVDSMTESSAALMRDKRGDDPESAAVLRVESISMCKFGL